MIELQQIAAWRKMKLQPYTTKGEFLQAQKQHGPGFVFFDNPAVVMVPEKVSSRGFFTFVDLNDESTPTKNYDFWSFSEYFLWEDGSPCGIPCGLRE